ncbi:Retrovirus-related Pol polyprotein from transposon gypsy, partial [Mucuna pruriens]
MRLMSCVLRSPIGIFVVVYFDDILVYSTYFDDHVVHVMPFGLTNALSTFMRLMNHVLRSLIGICVVVYFDDILLYSSCIDDCVVHVRSVLMLFQKEFLYVNFENCRFCTNELANTQFVSDVRSFHGLASFYRCFVKDFSTIAAPLNGIFKNNVRFKWEESQERVFQALKDKVMGSPVSPCIRTKRVIIRVPKIRPICLICHIKRKERRHEEEEPRRGRRYEEEPQRVRRYEEDPRRAPLDTLKCKIPPFIGDEDMESYLEWEIMVDQVLNGTNTLEKSKMGSKSVEEYFKEIKVALMRSNVLEFNKATMARFLHVSTKEASSHREPTPIDLAARKVRRKKQNDLERTRVQIRGVS